MNGFVALYVALASYGNLYIRQGIHAAKLDFDNSTLIYCGKLEFVVDATSKTPIAKTPEEWFEFLKKNGCQALKIFYWHSDQKQGKDHELVAFVGGGGNWIIEAIYGDYANYWVCKETVINRNANDKRGRGIEFDLIKKNAPVLDAMSTVSETKDNLRVSLLHILAFAEEHRPGYWANVFKSALSNLNSQTPESAYYKDAFVEKHNSLDCLQLLTSANIASVFGGMGSWNDIFYATDELQKQNDILSADLFDKINQAIVVAVNSGN